VSFFHAWVAVLEVMAILVVGVALIVGFFVALDALQKIVSDDTLNPFVNLAAALGMFLLVGLGLAPFVWVIM
jgi:uncharacterized protein YneF (UPF0154 family)